MNKFYNLFNKSPLPVYVLQDGRFKLVNSRMVEVTGYSHTELLDMPFSDLIYPADRARVKANALDRLKGKPVDEEYTFRAVDRDGKILHLKGFFSIIEFEGFPAILGQILDITQQLKVEDALKESEKRYRDILESIEEGYFEVDLAGNLQFFNSSLTRITGYSSAEIQGINYRKYTDKDNSSKLFRTFNKVYETGKNLQLFDWQINKKDGSTRYVETSVSLIESLGTKMGFRGIMRDITEKKKAEEALFNEKERLKVTIRSIGDAVMVTDTGGIITMLNPVAECLTGWSHADAVGQHVDDVFKIINEYTREPQKNPIHRVIKEGRTMGLANHTALLSRDGTELSIADSAAPIHDAKGNLLGVILVFRDVSKERQWEEALKASEEMYRTIFETTGTAMVIIDKDNTLSLVNREFEELSGYSKEELEGKMSWTRFVAEEDLQMMQEYHYKRRRDSFSAPRHHDFRFMNRYGKKMHVILTIGFLPSSKQSVASILDITRHKKLEKELKYLSWHDPLTGLYNRNFFEQEMHRIEEEQIFPVGIVVCDVDGLKLVNDTLGHYKGDELLVTAATIVKDVLRQEDVVSRIGGDEFAVLLPNEGKDQLEKIYDRIISVVNQYNENNPSISLSISIGFSAREGNKYLSMDDLFKKADNNMYREKLHRKQSARSAIVQTLMRALEARDFITEGHADRLQKLTISMGKAIALPEGKISDLRLLAQFHDIGKVGVSDRVLFKKGRLTKEEMADMKRHCEIGHRIALSTPDLAPIADWILKHHEWWNGQGYPLGLKKEDIPLECRMLSITDAFDAMTNDRPYRKALSQEQAISELIKYAGTQFDPELVPQFISFLRKQGESP